MKRRLSHRLAVLALVSVLTAPLASATPAQLALGSVWSAVCSWLDTWWAKVVPPGDPVPSAPGDHTDEGPDHDPWG